MVTQRLFKSAMFECFYLIRDRQLKQRIRAFEKIVIVSLVTEIIEDKVTGELRVFIRESRRGHQSHREPLERRLPR